MAYRKTRIWGQALAFDGTAATEADRRIPMYYRNSSGVPTAVVLGANDIVEIESVQAMITGAGTILMYDGADLTIDVEDRIWVHRAATAGGGSLSGANLIPSHFCKPGTYPKAHPLTGTAAHDVSFKGWLWELIS